MIEKISTDLKSGSKLTLEEFKIMEKKYLIDIKSKLQPPPVALSIGEYLYKGTYYPTPFGTYGNFSCLVGASKSYKTFLKSAVLSAYIGGESIDYFPNLRGHNTTDKFVIDVDTEQSVYHTQRATRRVGDMVGADYSLFKSYAIREEDPKRRFQFIEFIMMESEYRNNIGLITIDGAADITDSVNDLEEANKITQAMMKWTTISNSHLCTVLHKNPGTEKPTGHLGSAIMKKSETVAFVERFEDNIVKVTPNFTRNIAFKEFQFNINENHLPKEITDMF